MRACLKQGLALVPARAQRLRKARTVRQSKGRRSFPQRSGLRGRRDFQPRQNALRFFPAWPRQGQFTSPSQRPGPCRVALAGSRAVSVGASGCIPSKCALARACLLRPKPLFEPVAVESCAGARRRAGEGQSGGRQTAKKASASVWRKRFCPSGCLQARQRDEKRPPLRAALRQVKSAAFENRAQAGLTAAGKQAVSVPFRLSLQRPGAQIL